MSQIHPQARTTPRVRAEIQASEDSPAELARRYNISEPTAAKWQARDSVEDRSHRPHKLSTTLSPAQEAIVVELRRLLLLPLDDLLVITREFVNAQASRSALDRCLRRHGVNNLRELQAAASGESAQAAPPKRFKDYEPGFVHVDIKYLPQMPDETARRYLYVGIDRATRWVFVRIYADMETTSAVDFVNRLHEAAPMRIDKLLTDNGACFTDRFQRKSRTPSGKHHFDVRCRALGIEHRLCPPRHPQTNGLVERFNGRIAEITAQTRFHSAAELEQTLMNYVKVYNTRIPQRALDHHTPLDALKSWRAKSPDLFKKRPKNLPGLDTYAPALSVTADFSPASSTPLLLSSQKTVAPAIRSSTSTPDEAEATGTAGALVLSLPPQAASPKARTREAERRRIWCMTGTPASGGIQSMLSTRTTA